MSLKSCHKIVSSRPSGAIWRHISGPTLVQIIAYCWTAPSPKWTYHQMCSIVFNWQKFHDEFIRNMLGYYTLKITAGSPRAQWVNPQGICNQHENNGLGVSNSGPGYFIWPHLALISTNIITLVVSMGSTTGSCACVPALRLYDKESIKKWSNN